MKLKIEAKNMELKRDANVRRAMEKRLEDEQHQSRELHGQIESLKSSIVLLQQQIKRLHDTDNEHMVSLIERVNLNAAFAVNIAYSF